MFNPVEICQLKVRFVVVDNGGEGCSMGTNEDGLVRVGLKEVFQGSDIAFLNHGEGLPTWKMVVKICPLLLCKACKVINPVISDFSFSKIRNKVNDLSSAVC